MIEKATSVAHIQSMLATLRAHQMQASAGVGETPAAVTPSVQDVRQRPFGDLVKGAVAEVNATQVASRQLQEAYERGEVPLTDVVLGMQKSSIAFEATLQVRNKVLKAYEDILNMPV